jgi:hypothetical protein
MSNDTLNDYCAECGTDLNWWYYTAKKKVFKIQNDDQFCSKKCFDNYSLTFWTLTEVEIK